MTIHHLLILITLIMPGLLMPMEKELGKKRPAEDILEHEVTKVSRLDIDPLDLQEETMQDSIVSLPTPLIAALNQITPVSTPQLTPGTPYSPLSSLNEKPFKCDYTGCNFATKYKGNLTNHMRTHTGDKPFKCDQCDYTATQRSALTAHMKTHTGERPFKCDYDGCNFATAKKSNLATHKRTHTGEKPFKCDQCDYTATQRSALTAHMKTHTGEKPFKCDYEGCNYAAAQNSNLTEHMRTHTGEKPFKCDYTGCDYAAAQSNALTAHMKTHTGEKPFKCDYEGCNYAAAQKIHLATHMKNKKHTITAQNSIVSVPTPLIAALNQITPVSTPQLTPTSTPFYSTLFDETEIFMEKNQSSKRPAEDILEHEVTKVSRDDLQEETMQDSLVSLPTPLIATISQETPGTPYAPLSSLNDKKSFRCDHAGCNYAAVKKHHLTDHKRTHTDEKPYKCDYVGCDYAAAQKSNLTRHKRVHSKNSDIVSLSTPLIAALNQVRPVSTPLPDIFNNQEEDIMEEKS